MDSSVTFLLENLKLVVMHHVNLIGGAKNQFEQLEKELESLKARLKDGASLPNKTEVFKKWEKQIRDVVYDVEDTIDTHLIQAAVDKEKNGKSRFKGLTIGKSRVTLANEVKDLRENKIKPLLDKTKEDFARLPGANPSSPTNRGLKNDKRKKNPRQDNVVGFEDETSKLIGYINEESQQLEVISIIGMAGLGKTTVAWKIFQDKKIKFEFPTLIWLFISQEFNKRDMLLTILKKFTQTEMSGTTDAELAQKVREYLKRGKFLIIMDDVWTVDVWNDIKEVLPTENKMGKVLITSRYKTVATHANSRRDPHKLRFLDSEESWKLLQLEVYGALDFVDGGLEHIGQHIAKQCKGLPLSIIVIGGILLDKLSTHGQIAQKDEWKKVSQSVEKYLIRDEEKGVGSIISLSYTELPYDLRDCFLYLGMFPEDPEIPAWKLTKLWIAEGFIQQKPPLSLEEVAEENLKDLINRNLVMVHQTKPDGEVKTCRVHDTIREFCKTEADLKKQNLFREIIQTKSGDFEPPPEEIEKCRRICIHSFIHDFLKTRPTVSKARSLICFSKAPIILRNEDIATITNPFTLLRVLEANNLKFPKFPPKITTLLHLRYLTLSCEGFDVLPMAITQLWNLQTLIVDTSSRTLDIKADLWLLTQLRHLKTKASIVLKKDGKGTGGKNLQTLGRLSPQSCTEEAFNKAKSIGTLGIRGDISILSKSECLTKLKNLNKLKLVHDAFLAVASENPVDGLPKPTSFPPKLRILVLSGTHLGWHQMSTLRQLETLAVLKLKDNAFTGDFWDDFVGGFRNLEFLYMERTNLLHWVASSDAFPALRHLVIKNCEKLQEVPPQLIENLETLYLERVTPFAVKSAKKIEKAKNEMQELPKGRRGGFKLVVAPGDQLIDLS